MAKLKQNAKVSISDIVADRSRNVREQTDDAYAIPNLMADIATIGQRDNVTLELVNGKYYPIRGFRRVEALKQLRDGKVIDPNTQKPFEFVKADVYEGLTDLERFQLLLDHGQRKGLSKVELLFAMFKSFDAQYSEKETVILLRSLLEDHYRPTRPIKDENDLFNYYRGVLQTAKRAYGSPDVVRDAWVKKMRGEQAWPRKAEMEQAYNIFVKEMERDTTNQISRSKPGPEFLAFWNDLLKKQKEAEAEGKEKAKASNMQSRQQIEDMKKQSNSLIVKTIVDFVMRRQSPDKFPAFDKLVTQAEASMTDDIKQAIVSLLSDSE